ncbi:MAG: 16S rRNA (guanine(527)-N(7))-methyltransferase RsmG [Alphaproteobacteria bacterium]|nr:16S rRNA (guanine(527)-N(7))-methyltransferase RsmG [Alphaproteobacteria bacterium]MBN2675334.1 16S rRNA (guanine(527)-N(7))-methyltransferase RsmG [Alphaproteobacteria bacterium]
MNNKEKFIKYAEMLHDWSSRMNLVAPSTLVDIENRHFKDSMQLADILPSSVNIADLGSGAGFPGVVLAIMGWNVTCIESIGKKADYLKALKHELDLPNLTIFHGRAEDFIKNIKSSKSEIIFTARAFASLIKIMDYVYPIKTRLFLLKGREIESEVSVAKEKYNFDYKLTQSKTGDGFIIQVDNIKLFHMK